MPPIYACRLEGSYYGGDVSQDPALMELSHRSSFTLVRVQHQAPMAMAGLRPLSRS
jgi:hypothetical protein